MTRTAWIARIIKKANHYIRDIEKAAIKEVELEEKSAGEAGKKAGKAGVKGRSQTEAGSEEKRMEKADKGDLLRLEREYP